MTFERKLGRSGIAVSALGMGCWAIGGPFWEGTTPLGWGKVDDRASIDAIHRAHRALRRSELHRQVPHFEEWGGHDSSATVRGSRASCSESLNMLQAMTRPNSSADAARTLSIRR